MTTNDEPELLDDEPQPIDEIIKSELEREAGPPPFLLSKEEQRQTNASNKIIEAFLSRVRGNPFSGSFGYQDLVRLTRMIKRSRLNKFYANIVFVTIEMELKEILTKIVALDTRSPAAFAMPLEMFNSIAVNYFTECLDEELRDVHVAEILHRTKATLAQLEVSDGKFFRQAVEKVKDNAEMRIELAKEEKLNRELIYEPEGPREETLNLKKEEKADNRMKRQDARGLSQESAFLVFDYLLNYAIQQRNLHIQIKDRADVVEFLSGYSRGKLKNVSSWHKKQVEKNKENDETEEKIFQTMKIVRKQFETLGLQDIVDQIDQDQGG